MLTYYGYDKAAEYLGLTMTTLYRRVQAHPHIWQGDAVREMYNGKTTPLWSIDRLNDIARTNLVEAGYDPQNAQRPRSDRSGLRKTPK